MNRVGYYRCFFTGVKSAGVSGQQKNRPDYGEATVNGQESPTSLEKGRNQSRNARTAQTPSIRETPRKKLSKESNQELLSSRGPPVSAPSRPLGFPMGTSGLPPPSKKEYSGELY